MNFNINKKFFLDEEDLSVFDGPRLLFKVSELKDGFFVYNKSGEGIAQIVFQKKYAFITLRSDDKPTLPVRIIKKGSHFDIEFYDFSLQGNNFHKAKLNPYNTIEIAGSPKKYNYKISDNNEEIVTVTPGNDQVYNVDISSSVNNLKMLLSVITIEKMLFDL